MEGSDWREMLKRQRKAYVELDAKVKKVCECFSKEALAELVILKDEFAVRRGIANGSIALTDGKEVAIHQVYAKNWLHGGMNVRMGDLMVRDREYGDVYFVSPLYEKAQEMNIVGVVRPYSAEEFRADL